jgi:hypothetical protein
VFGQTKEARGFRHFGFRGREAVSKERRLISLTHSLLKSERGACETGRNMSKITLGARTPTCFFKSLVGGRATLKFQEGTALRVAGQEPLSTLMPAAETGSIFHGPRYV